MKNQKVPYLFNKAAVVDDDDSTRQWLSEAFEDDKIARDFCYASEGGAGFKLISDEIPDLALVDCNLPDISGYELTKKLRGNGYAGFIISISAFPSEDTIYNAFFSGADYFLPKDKYDAGFARHLRESLMKKRFRVYGFDELTSETLTRPHGRRLHTPRQPEEILLSQREKLALRKFLEHFSPHSVNASENYWRKDYGKNLKTLFSKYSVNSYSDLYQFVVSRPKVVANIYRDRMIPSDI